MVSVACLGRLGRLELAGGALAVGLTNITGYSVLSGLSLGLEPISSQAFGSRNLPLLSLALRRTVILLLLASLPISLLWLNLRPLLLFLNLDPAVANLASLYSLFSLPDLLASSLLLPLRIHLRSQNHLSPLFYSAALSSLLHFPLALSLSSSLGVSGVALASSAASFLTLLFLLPFSTLSPITHYSENGPTTSAEWGPLLRLAIPSCLAVCLEWWWYELMTLASGYLHNSQVALATSAIVIQTTSLMYMLPTTISAAAAVRVGNELGAGRPGRARAAARVAMGLAVVGSCLSLTWAILCREEWGRVFTRDGKVLELTKAVLPVVGLCELANCPQTSGCGVLRGTARPAVGAAINLYSFYLVGAPVAVVLAFGLDLGFVGLCLGLLTAQVVCAVSVVTVVMLRTDWEREAARAVDLVGRGKGKVVEEDGGPIGPTDGGDEDGGLLKEVVTV